MSIQRWFYLNLSRKDAENLLLSEGIRGSYLVRESHNNIGNFTLCVRRDSDIVNIKISNNGDYFDIATGSEFASLSELILYYADEGNKLYEKNGNLVEPKYPLLSLGNNNDSFIPGVTNKLAEELLVKDGRQNCYLIRESLTNRGDFVLCILLGAKVVATIIEHQKNGQYMMKGVDVKNSFASLAKLVQHYKHHHITIQGNIEFKLGEPVKFGTTSANAFPDFNVSDPILSEFEILQNDVSCMSISRNVGQLHENKDSNRYKNIVPYDTTRVILNDRRLEMTKNDYINASHVNIPNGGTSFIATQGCLLSTCVDFWRMVWQFRSHIIVMITKCFEHGKNKCVNYWPSNEEPVLTYNLAHALLTVRLVDAKTCQDKSYVLRRFTLELNTLKDNEIGASRESREVHQYHFVGWPDKSVPDSPKSLVVFLLKVLQHQTSLPDPGPIVTHCSAGIGRTGTFIALYYLILQIQKDGKTDVLGVVKAMRNCRPGMVQIDEQYRFIYSCLHFYTQTLNHVTPPLPLPPPPQVKEEDSYCNIPMSPPSAKSSK